MKQINFRTVEIDYCPDDLRFDSEDQAREFFFAIGRQIMGYVHRGETPGVLEYTKVSVRHDEILALHHEPVEPTRDELRWPYDYRQRHPGRPFVVGAVRHEDGTYTFHS